MAINKVILLGNVGREPEVRYLDGGVCFARFSIATSDRAYTTAAGVQVPERTEWHNVVAWRGLAQIVEKYVTKGTQIYVEGKLQTRQWDDQSGVKRYTTEILIDNIELLGGRREQANAGDRPPIPAEPPAHLQQRNYQQAQAAATTPSPAAPSAMQPPSSESNPPFDASEGQGDLPF